MTGLTGTTGRIIVTTGTIADGMPGPQ